MFFPIGPSLVKSALHSGSWVNDLACGKGFERVPEAAHWLQGTELMCMLLELPKQTGLLYSLVGEKGE